MPTSCMHVGPSLSEGIELCVPTYVKTKWVLNAFIRYKRLEYDKFMFSEQFASNRLHFKSLEAIVMWKYYNTVYSSTSVGVTKK